MTDVPDARLMELFARNGSEEAFAELVERHVALVHSVALRHTANPQLAQDITQAVFMILARKAGTLGRKTVLPGWLYHTTRLTAANVRRAETRRVRREQEAFMLSKIEESATDALWRELSPQLDEAMACLGTSDRDALVLRYFQNKSVAEVAKSLELEENAAQKRISRALEKLRKFFTKRGMSLTTVIIAGAISANSVHAVPVVLTQSVTAAALAKGGAASGSTLTLIKGTLKLMAWTKLKPVAGIGVALFLAAITTVVIASKMDDGAPPKLLIATAAAKLSDLANYTSERTIKSSAASNGQPITIEERVVKDVTYQAVGFPGLLHEMVRRGSAQAIRDGASKNWNEIGVEGRQIASLTNSVQTLLDGVEELKDVDGVFSGNLTETAARGLSSPMPGTKGIPATKGSVKFWIKDGLLSKYEVVFSAQSTAPDGKSREINLSTTTVSITNVGTTTIPVPAAVLKDLGK